MQSSFDEENFKLPFSLKNIQAVRLCMALLETNFSIHFNKEDSAILEYLNDFFPLDYKIGTENIYQIDRISFNHQVPSCSIGNIEKTLIFPHGITNRCKSFWPQIKSYDFVFSGLITQKRAATLNRWLENNFEQIFKIKTFQRNYTIFSKLLSYFTIKRSQYFSKKNNVLFFSSSKGREWPVKAWDEKYYINLSKSKYVLCPDGDFIWTYRFFEALLCGAIPIIENYCSDYEGFFFYTMDDKIENMYYDENKVQSNFNKAVDYLTIPKKLLNREIINLLS